MTTAYQLTDKQRLELKTTLMGALARHTDENGMMLGCTLSEFTDRVVRSYEKKLNEKLSLKRFSINLN
jgi:hypothetical protein